MAINPIITVIYFLCAISLIHATAINRSDLRKRQTTYEVQKNVVVVEQVNVYEQTDGSFMTAAAVPVTTTLSLSEPSPLPNADKEDKITPPAPAILSAPASESVPGPLSQLRSKEEQPADEPEEEQQPEDPEDPDTEDEPIVVDPTPPPTPEAQPAALNSVSAQLSSAPSTPVAAVNQPEKQSTESTGTQDSKISQTSVNPGTQSRVAASKSAKRGVAYNDVTKLSAFQTSSKVSWAYNWGSTTPSIQQNVEYVPMLWGMGDHATGWTDNANKAIAAGSTHLLAFNEPDLDSQSGLSVSDAAAGYKQLMQPFAGKAMLGSPAVTNGASPMGLSYLKNFIAACSGCTIDFVAIHWYNGGDASDFKNYVKKAYDAGGGRPVWITEFEASGDVGQQKAFLDTVLPWLDQQDYVQRYAYFMASDGNLISSGTTLSQVGQAFAFGG